MNLDSLSFTLSQISYLVANLSKKNFKQSSQELANLVQSHGLEADRHLLRCLFSHVDLSIEGNKTSSGGSKDCLQTQLLIQECENLLFKPTLITLLCYAFDNPLHHQKSLKPSQHLFPQLRKLLKLTPVQEVVFGLALQHSSNPELQKIATQFVWQKLPELITAYIDGENSRQLEGGLHDTTPEALHLILTSLSKETGIVSAEVQEILWKQLQRDFPREHVPAVLAPVLYSNFPDLPMDKSQDGGVTSAMLDAGLPSLVVDVGAAFTSSVEGCKNMIVSLTANDLTPAVVAQTITAMIRSPPADSKHPGSEWNMEIFIQAVKELQPSINWRDVLFELDNPKFIIRDRNAFLLLFSGIRLFFDTFPFPIDVFYRRWNNTEGQFSLFHHILKNPDTFCFGDHIYHAVPVETLKASPDSDNKELATWRSLDLIEILVWLGERCGLYTQVLELFKFPITHCPDVLMVGILQSQPPFGLVRQELISMLMPTFLGIHPNSTIVLQHAWNTPSLHIVVRPIVMSSMAEWYLRSDSDQAKLSRILDIAQELKALTLILTCQAFPFVIDLACLASRRGYLKLDKWLSDKIREHGETFISACVKFLQRRCPQIAGGVEKDIPAKAAQLPQETLTTVLGCLQSCAANVSQELSESIMSLIGNCSYYLNKSRQAPGVLRHRGLDGSFNAFASPQLDQISSLTTSLGAMNLVPSMSTGLGALVSTPGSPSRMLTSSQSPYSSIYIGPGLQHPVTASQVGGGVSVGGTHRGPTQVAEKPGVANNVFGDSQPVSKEVEDEANSYFQRIYNVPPHPTLSIEEVLDMLKKFNESTKQRERDVFRCMVKNLFEEYRFFPQYPDKELHVTAQLFGGIIERNLVPSYLVLGMALRFVLDALRKPCGTKMYYFGIAALDRFKSKLKEYQKYCEHVANIAHFSDFPPHLIDYINYGLQGNEPPNRPQGQVLPAQLAAMLQQQMPGTTKAVTTTTLASTAVVAKVTTTASTIPSRPSIANATNIDTLLVATEKEEKITPPSEALQDKIGFIFNNLSQLNIQSKGDELRDLIGKQHYAWMAQYIVLKRATIEHNFHSLYSNFLEVLKLSELTELVLRETFRNIRVLLRSDKGIANFSDRSLLKNLGHWLGILSLAKNKPILFIEIDFKSLIIEAYAKGQQELLYVIPFVSKVIESCAKSKVFKPRNPWTMAVMNLLAELHQEPELKLNLKFEIEVLCKSLDLNLDKLTPTNLLKDPKRLETLETQLSKSEEEQQQQQPQPIAAPQPVPTPVPKPTLLSANEEMQQIANATAAVAAAAAAAVSSVAPTAVTPNPTVPPEPRYHVMDLNVTNVSNVANHILINNSLPIFQTHPQLKQHIRLGVERAISEWIGPVMDRSVKIAAYTTENIVRRDFGLDPDVGRMRSAAHSLVRCLTVSMAMITCRDHMPTTISNNLKQLFTSALHGQPKHIIEQAEGAATVVAEDNMELACAFIQKASWEKATVEIDKRLNEDYEARKLERSKGRAYCHPTMLTYQNERMPEAIRHPVGGVSPHRFSSVYGECGKTNPGFRQISDRDMPFFMSKPAAEMQAATGFVGASNTAASFPDDETGVVMDKLINELEIYFQPALSASGLLGATNPRVVALNALRDTALLARRSREPALAIGHLLQKAVEGLLEGMANCGEPEQLLWFRDAHLRVLKALSEILGPHLNTKQVTRCFIEARDEIKFNIEAVDCLIRSGLLLIKQVDEYIAQSVENGLNFSALVFGMQLIQAYLIDDRQNSIVTETDLQHTISALIAVHSSQRETHPGLGNLLERLRAANDPTALTDMPPSGPVTFIHAGLLLVRNRGFDDDMVRNTELIIVEWIQAYTQRELSKGFTMVYQQMNVAGFLKNEEVIGKFLRIAAELCISSASGSRGTTDVHIREKAYHTLDAYAKLVYLLFKHTGDASSATTKLNLLNRTLGIITGLLLSEHDTRSNEFNQMPYERLYITLFNDLTQPDPLMEAISMQFLTSFCHVFYLVRPMKAAKFAYAWLELISHRNFLPRLLAPSAQQKGWPMYAQLLTALFKFLAPFLRNTDLPKPVSYLYRGTLRVLLVLLHDFPEFLCDYHYGFCDVIPANCIQMRNLILSAFPRNMRLPDPFTPNLKVDILQEIAIPPRMVSNVAAMITPATFRKDLDSYLKQRSPVTFLSDLRSNLQVNCEIGMNYNVQLMNALVLYVGSQAIQHIRNKGLSPNMSTIASSAHMDIFQNLGVDLDTEGRYLFLNAIANQLRYPNSHTHYFSCLLLSLFAESNTESIQEQITRVLLERLIVNRPHPWGLLITFIELIKNPTYKFWSHEFVHCAPEIEKLFESVARSCMVSKQVNQTNENDVGEPLAV